MIVVHLRAVNHYAIIPMFVALVASFLHPILVFVWIRKAEFIGTAFPAEKSSSPDMIAIPEFENLMSGPWIT